MHGSLIRPRLLQTRLSGCCVQRRVPVTVLRAAAAPRARRMHVRADLWATVDQVVTTGALTIGVGATLLAIFADRLPVAKIKDQQEASFKWGVMGAISCLPLFNWMAWVFAALEDEERARMYYWFAALYAIPLLHSGLKVDSFTIAMLLTGVAHIQAERIASTEPELQASIAKSLTPLSVIKSLAKAAGAAGSALLPSRAEFRRELPPGDGRQAWEERVQGGGKTREEELEERLRKEELLEFDRRMKEREARRRGSKR